MISLTIATPAYNEQDSLEQVVLEYLEKIEPLVDDLEILLVNDGSSDNTGVVMEKLRKIDPRIRIIHHPFNLGFYGIAHTLAKNARMDFYAGVSADGEVNIDGLAAMIAMVRDEGYDIVVGNRPQKPNYNGFRKFVSRSYNGLVQTLFGCNFKDPGWLKIHRTHILQELDTISKGAFINAERLIKAHYLGYKIGNAEVTQRKRLGGKAKGARLQLVIRSFYDLLRVFLQVRIFKKIPKREPFVGKNEA